MNAADSSGGEEGPRHLFLVDGSGYIFRAYYGLKSNLTRSDGTPTNAVYGFCNMLMKLLDDIDADYLAVIFDAARKTFRNDIYADYKANRPPPPEDLIPQFPLVLEATEAFNVPAIEMPGFEADDLIATYARQAREAGDQVTIMSSDKDLMQLVTERVTMLDPIHNRRIGAEEVVEKFGVGPGMVVEVQALAGDSVDNVPGVPGIGVKTAAQLINEFGDLETVLARAGEIKQPKRRENLLEFADLARISLELVTLKDDVPVEGDYRAFAKRQPDHEKLLKFLRAQEFERIVARVMSEIGGDGLGAEAAATAGAEAVPGSGYQLVTEEAELEAWIAAATEKGRVAVDTETTSLDAQRAVLVGVSLALEPGRACYIPLGHRGAVSQGALDLGDGGGQTGGQAGGLVEGQIDRAAALALLAPMLGDPSVLKVGHNIKYDTEILAGYDVHIAPVDDTMVLSYVLDAGRHGHGLDELALRHLDHTNIKFSEVAGVGKKQVTFDLVPLEVARDYAAEDADITLRLHDLLKPRLMVEHLSTVYETLERPLIPVLVAMERAGIEVDPKCLKALSRDFAKRLGVLETEIQKLAGREFNIASPKQLGEILFEEMGLPGGKKGKAGAWSTGADVLEDLAARGHDLAARVLDWRLLAKLRSTYTDALQKQINPDTGRVHTSYAMAIASTGRLSSTDPNLQNIPVRTEEGRKIREAFIARDGAKLLSADYSQIELRLLAHVADITALKEAFRHGADIHALTASEIFGVPLDRMDAATRRSAKAINFGIIYGISPFGLARQLGIPQQDAKSYIEAYFQRYPGIRDYMEDTKALAREQGFVTTIFGRRMHTPGITAKGPHKAFAERAAINAPLQGAAADIIKRAMIRVPPALRENNLGAEMLLQVHDELIFEVPEAEAEATAQLVAKVMADAPFPAVNLSVPLEVETGIGASWAEVH
ncbi:MAG: DNA polymerase I [Alphaproteobacteria bacterium]